MKAESTESTTKQTADDAVAEARIANRQNRKLWSEVSELQRRARASSAAARSGVSRPAVAAAKGELQCANHEINFLREQVEDLNKTIASLTEALKVKDDEVADWENQFEAQHAHDDFAADDSDRDGNLRDPGIPVERNAGGIHPQGLSERKEGEPENSPPPEPTDGNRRNTDDRGAKAPAEDRGARAPADA